MRIFKSIWTYFPGNKKEDYSGIPSMTMPGMSLTPAQIMERFTSGRPMAHIPGYYEYNGDRTGLVKDLPDITRYDYFDQIEYYEQLGRELAQLKGQLLKGSNKSLENTLADKIAAIQHKIDHPELYDKNGNLIPTETEPTP